MTEEYELCWRDPRSAVCNMLSNPGFDGEFDAAPYREYDQNGVRQYENVMSGDWAWRQAVRAWFLCTGLIHSISLTLKGSHCKGQ